MDMSEFEGEFEGTTYEGRPLCDGCKQQPIITQFHTTDEDTLQSAWIGLCKACSLAFVAPEVLTCLSMIFRAVKAQIKDPRVAAMMMTMIHKDIEHGNGDAIVSIPVIDPRINDPENTQELLRTLPKSPFDFGSDNDDDNDDNGQGGYL